MCEHSVPARYLKMALKSGNTIIHARMSRKLEKFQKIHFEVEISLPLY